MAVIPFAGGIMVCLIFIIAVRLEYKNLISSFDCFGYDYLRMSMVLKYPRSMIPMINYANISANLILKLIVFAIPTSLTIIFKTNWIAFAYGCIFGAFAIFKKSGISKMLKEIEEFSRMWMESKKEGEDSKGSEYSYQDTCNINRSLRKVYTIQLVYSWILIILCYIAYCVC